MKVNPEIIVAVDCEGGFGKEGKIPWYLPEDFKHFKELTSGHVCIMGRRTYQEMLDARVARDLTKGITEPIDEILRGRQSFVVTSNQEYQTPGANKVSGLGKLMAVMNTTNDTRKLFVIGGRRMFIEALTWVNTIHMTVLKGDPYDCDVKFPIDVLNKKYKITEGKETDKAYYVTYTKTK